MFTWLAQNLATLLICIGLATVVALILIGMKKGRKKGKSSCGGSCGGCPMSGKCHGAQPQKVKR